MQPEPGMGDVVCRRVSEIEAQPIRWLWPGRIARGKVSLLVGDPGLGKSQITASMAATVSAGGIWPVDGVACDRGRVILLSAEDDVADTIRPRLESAGADLDRVEVLEGIRDRDTDGQLTQRPFNLRADLARLDRMLTEKADVLLVVIDPVSAYLGGTDSHNNADVRALLAPLADLASRHGVAIVCVSHLNKSANMKALHRVTGSLAFAAAARAAFVVTKDPDDPASDRRLMLPLKNNLAKDQEGLAFRIEDCRLTSGIECSRIAWEPEPVKITAEEAMTPAGDPEERSAGEEAEEFLRDQLLPGIPRPARDILGEANQAGISEKTLRRAKSRLSVKVVRTDFGKAGRWEWMLPKVAGNGLDAYP